MRNIGFKPSESPSIHNLWHYLEANFYPIRKISEYGSRRDFYEEILPEEIIKCMRYKTSDRNERNSNASWLYLGDSNANGRRKEILKVLRGEGSKKACEAKRASMIRHIADAMAFAIKGSSESTSSYALSKTILDEHDCIPFPEGDKRDQYLEYMRYYVAHQPRYALAYAFLMLLLGTYAEEAMELLFTQERQDFEGDTVKAVIYLYETRKYQEALSKAERIVNKTNASTEDEVMLYLVMGHIYRNDSSSPLMPRRAFDAYQKAYKLTKGESEEAAYYLFRLPYDDLVSEGSDAREMRSHLQSACEKNHREALLDMASFYLNGDSRLKIKQDYQKALDIYEKGMVLGDPVFFYGYAVTLEKTGNIEAAKNTYYQAYKLGSKEAAFRLNQLRMGALDTTIRVRKTQTKSTQKYKNTVIYNEQNKMTMAFYNTLPDNSRKQWAITKLEETSIREQLEKLVVSSDLDREPKQLVFLLFSEDDENNFVDARRIVLEMNRYVSDGVSIKDISEGVKIFVRVKDRGLMAESRIDQLNALYLNNNKNVDDVPFYKIIICDDSRDASIYLLSHAPVFLGGGNILILGDGRMANRLVKDILAVMPVRNLNGDKTSISIVGSNSEEIDQALRVEAPGFFEKTKTGEMRAPISFYKKTDYELLQTMLEVDEDEPTPFSSAVLFSRYIIVCDDNPKRNAELAIAMRERLTSIHLSGSIHQVIAAYVNTDDMGEGLMFAGTQGAPAYEWYANYRIIPFGTPTQLYSYQMLMNNQLRKKAFRLHSSFYGDAEEMCEIATGSYYSSFYNRDSSLMAALSAIYAANAAGFALADPDLYGTKEEAQLAEPYHKWLNEYNNLELAAVAEHARWCSFMYSRGWRRADVPTAEMYMTAGSPTHQLQIAKIHPFLCDWDELDTMEKQFNRMMHSLKPGYKDRDLKEIDRDMVRKSAELLMP